MNSHGIRNEDNVAMIYPENNTLLERRKHKRAEFDWPVGYHVRDTNRFCGCLGCDISLGGLKVLLTEFIAVHTMMEVCGNFTDTHTPVNLQVQIVWLRKVPYSEMYYAGLKFEEPDSSVTRRIHVDVQSHLS